MKPLLRLFLVVLVLTVPTFLVGQGYLLKQIGYKEGLVSGGIDGIVFDEEGYMWFGGDDDLCRYDGVSLQKCDQTNGWPISDGWVQNLSLDSLNNLWICCTDTCLFSCSNKNRSNKKFVFYPDIKKPIDVVHLKGSTWITTSDKIFQITNNKVTGSFPFPNDVQISRYNPMDYFGNHIYVSTFNGLCRFDITSKSFDMLTTEDGLLSNSVFSVHRITDELYIVHDSSVTVLKNNQFNPYFKSNEDEKIKYIFKDPKGMTWMVGRKGIIVLENKKILYRLNMKNNSFQSNEFTFGCTDPENNIWIASATNGIYQIRKLGLTRFGDPKEDWSPVYGITQDKQNNYWFGHYNSYFMVRLSTEPTVKSDTIYVKIDPTLATFDSINDRIWFSGYDGVVSIKDEKITTYNDLSLFASDKLWNSVFNPYDSAVYITGADGLTKIKNGKLEKIYPENLPSDQNDIFIYEGAPTTHGMYLATKYGVKNLVDGKIVDVPGLNQGRDIRTNVIIIASDQYQNAWSDLGNNTLVRIGIDKQNKVFVKKYNLYQMFGLKGPFNICVHKNFFVIKNFSEVYIMDLISILKEKPVLIRKLSQYDGLFPEAPQYQELFFDNNDYLWICGGFGAYCYRFLEDSKNTLEPKVHISEIRINGIKEDLSTISDGKSDKDELPLNLKLPYSKNEISFEYIGITFKGNENVFYKTRLLGLQNEWSAPFRDRHITYNNLSPGKYTFQLMSCNNDGVWNKEPYSFTFHIKPPWYQQTWFRLLAAAALAGLIYLLFMIRIYRLKQAKNRQEKFTQAILESQEEERKRISRDLHDGLGQELSMLKMGAEKEKNSGTLTRINKIIEDVRFMSRNLHPHYFEKLGLTKALEHLVEENKELGKIYWIHEIENIDVYFKPQQQLIIFRIVQECINNITKHSQAKNAKLTATHSNSKIIISLMDNGIGFNVDQKKISSLGLSTIMERVKQLNGTISIKSKPGSGTNTEITIPVHQG